MFKKNDKITLNLINARDIDGNIFPFTLKLPLNDKEYKLPKNIAAIDVFEYQEGSLTGGFIAFKIYIGKKSNLSSIIDSKEIKKIEVKNNLTITSLSKPVCYQNINGTASIFAMLNEQDIVVENEEKLMIIIEQLSNEFTNFCNSTKNIRKLSKKKI